MWPWKKTEEKKTANITSADIISILEKFHRKCTRSTWCFGQLTDCFANKTSEIKEALANQKDWDQRTVERFWYTLRETFGEYRKEMYKEVRQEDYYPELRVRLATEYIEAQKKK